MNQVTRQDLSPTEMFPVVDANGNVIGKASRQQCHSGSLLLHPVVHLHVFDRQGRIYLQKRSQFKHIQPGKWDTAVGGHVDYGETPQQALLREAAEELGLTQFTPQPLLRYVFESQVERELVNTYCTVTTQQQFAFDTSEIDDGRFWTVDEVRAAMGKGILTPNFEQEFLKILPLVKIS